MLVDVAICGAGPVGCTLGLALSAIGRKVLLVESRPQGPATGPLRPIALSYASRLILERAGAWDGFAATPIDAIHVSQAGSAGRTQFSAADARLPALGYVASYGELGNALADRAAASFAELRFGCRVDATDDRAADIGITLSSGEHLQAACLVHAEGASAGMDEKPYAQQALVAEIETLPAARGRAWERFTAEGPLALLPYGSRYAAVWGASPARVQTLAGASDAAFLDALQDAFGRRAGRFVGVHGRSSVPLALRRRARRVLGRQVYVGNAAQTLHPVAGQGLNLGLRDAWDLARAISRTGDAGDPAALHRYGRARTFDVRATIGVTDLLATLFADRNPLFGATRGAAMLALDACPPARRFFARRMVFGPSAIP
ncbi:MAG: 2-octaprenyl-6-methoxyphenyl hydroxylase [Betaproteobacteria bacterium]|nr:2-octaprenyl-6-methoxyphenyl hydroxylase [Betaproteobacteria bacterium]